MSDLELVEREERLHLRPSQTEKAIASVVVAVVILLLGWNGKSALDTSTAVEVLSTKLDALQTSQLQVTTADRRYYDQRIDGLDKRVSLVETKMAGGQ